jgi:hypothetical protein
VSASMWTVSVQDAAVAQPCHAVLINKERVEERGGEGKGSRRKGGLEKRGRETGRC